MKMDVAGKLPRPYARRMSFRLRRDAMLSVRVHDDARKVIAELAKGRQMSVSEYAFRVLIDHIRTVRS